MKRAFCVSVIALTLLCLSSRTHAQSTDVLLPHVPEYEQLTPEYLENHIQKMVNETYLDGFRHMGAKEDFFHGHILIINGKPRVILYHTQERAYSYHKSAPGSRFDYLDTQKRNWIQWLDTGRVENAMQYTRNDYPDTPRWNKFEEGWLLHLESRYTVTATMLDPELIGGKIERVIKFDFYDTDKYSSSITDKDMGAINVFVPTKGKVQLRLGNIMSYPPLSAHYNSYNN